MIRNIKKSDLPEIRKLVAACHPLGFHTLYTYWVLQHHFGDLCFVSEEEGRLAGLITGLVSGSEGDTAFLWQIGVRPDFQGQGIAGHLVDCFASAVRNKGLGRIQLSIDPENPVSIKTFESFARKEGLVFRKIERISLSDEFSDYPEEEDLYEIFL
ncbi:MAG: GNAT family N-acetyltransferase [Spirochaetales bacterium]|nr:GNAT family N-acetyltransferase [Spirochaetales bacterium]